MTTAIMYDLRPRHGRLMTKTRQRLKESWGTIDILVRNRPSSHAAAADAMEPILWARNGLLLTLEHSPPWTDSPRPGE